MKVPAPTNNVGAGYSGTSYFLVNYAALANPRPRVKKSRMNRAELFARDGFVVLEGIFDPAFVDELRTEYLRQFPDVASSPERYRVGDRRLQVPLEMTGPFLSPNLYAHPALLGLAKGLLGEDHLIESLAIVTALPRAKAQRLHLDHQDLAPGNDVVRALIGTYGITVAIPLVDLTPDTGTTKLFTRSHVTKINEDEFDLPYIGRGGCYAMDYRLWHQGTANQSAMERPLVYLVYARPWFTDITNYGNADRIRIAPQDLAAVPNEYRRLFRRLSPDRSWPGTRSA